MRTILNGPLFMIVAALIDLAVVALIVVVGWWRSRS
jgi:hypothetical protein